MGHVPAGLAPGARTADGLTPGRNPTAVWRREVREGEAADLHAAWPAVSESPGQRAVALCSVTSAAVVLGSTQRDTEIDMARAARSGVRVARRRSGGGAVLVAPGEPLWVDLWLPAGDPLWSDDVSRSFDWAGEAWVGALARVGLGGLVAHRPVPRETTRWAGRVCFGGVGRGEVVAEDGRKLVGLAQRRTRAGAWFHCACVLRWDPTELLDVLAMRADDRAAAVRELRAAAVGAVDLSAERGLAELDAPALATALADSLPGAAGL